MYRESADLQLIPFFPLSKRTKSKNKNKNKRTTSPGWMPRPNRVGYAQKKLKKKNKNLDPDPPARLVSREPRLSGLVQFLFYKKNY
jgi:hypothetical protein